MGKSCFYLTAKTITRSVAEETFELLRERENLYFSTVTITAKEKAVYPGKTGLQSSCVPKGKGTF